MGRDRKRIEGRRGKEGDSYTRASGGEALGGGRAKAKNSAQS
jgi:hypothetical protein